MLYEGQYECIRFHVEIFVHEAQWDTVVLTIRHEQDQNTLESIFDTIYGSWRGKKAEEKERHRVCSAAHRKITAGNMCDPQPDLRIEQTHAKAIIRIASATDTHAGPTINLAVETLLNINE